MIIINVIYILFYDFSTKLGIYGYLQSSNPISLTSRLYIFFRYLGTPDLGGATWFLMVLFTIEIIFKLISNLNSKLKIFLGDIIGSCIVAAIGWKYISTGIQLPYLVDLSFFGCIFFSLGVIVRRYSVFSKYIDKKVMIPFSIIVNIFLGSFYFANQIPMNWPTRQFPAFSINLLGTICGIYLCYIISKILEQSDILKRIYIQIGRNTYCILVSHFFMFKCIFMIGIIFKLYPMNYLKELVPKYSPGLQWIIITMVTICMCMIVSKIAEKSRILNYIFNARLIIRREKTI